MLLGLLLTYGIQPGPTIITDHLDLMYLIVWSFAIASVLGAALCFGGTRYLARLTTVPFAVLGPGLVVIMLLGAFQESGQLGDLWVMIALGVFGWLLKATDYPRAPFLIGFVLAVPLERYYFLTVNVYDGASWLLRPWVLVFLLILIAPAVLAGHPPDPCPPPHRCRRHRAGSAAVRRRGTAHQHGLVAGHRARHARRLHRRLVRLRGLHARGPARAQTAVHRRHRRGPRPGRPRTEGAANGTDPRRGSARRGHASRRRRRARGDPHRTAGRGTHLAGRRRRGGTADRDTSRVRPHRRSGCSPG